MTRLCVPIFVESLDQARRDVGRAIEGGADIIELRLDTVADVATAIQIQQSFEKATFLLTRRPERQGGHNEEEDATRLNWLNEGRGDRGSWVDLEADTDAAALRYWFLEHDASHVILSQHDFKTRPANLTKTFVEMQQSPAAVAKLAWQARSIRDNVEAFELMQAGPKPTIAICMGEAGAISRILAKKFGAFLTFASLSDTSATAPGQLTIDQLKQTFRWDRLKPTTKVYGVVGSPVGHSMSPAIHNAGFDAIDFDGIYVPLLVQPGYESFKAFIETFRAFAPLDLRGLSITIPHKENALRYAREAGGFEIDPLAERIGAVNTYALGEDGRNVALSTDYAAILDTITSALGIDRDGLSKLRVAVVGAGGTGRTAVAALAHYGASVTVFNRNPERAHELATDFNGKSGRVIAAPIEMLCHVEADVFVNTTSVGMSPNSDASIFDEGVPKLTASSLVFDTVYNPLETKLLTVAKHHGARTAGGIEMFIRQAAGQFALWTGVSAPTDVMRTIVEARLRG